MKARNSLSLKTTARRRGLRANRPRRDAGAHLTSARGSTGNADPRPARASTLSAGGDRIGVREATGYIAQYNEDAISTIHALPSGELVRQLRMIRGWLRQGDGPPGRPHRRYYECLLVLLETERASRQERPPAESAYSRGITDDD
jgi:hypothetical protein